MKRIPQLYLFVVIVISAALIWMAMAGAAASAHANDDLISPKSAAPHDVLVTSHWRPINLSDTTDLTSTTAVTIYLPLISTFVPRVQAGIYGQVTYQGTLVGGIDLRLNRCFYDGTYWSCPGAYALYTSTLTDGSYQFPGASSLAAGEKYYVSWYNGYNASGNPDYVSEWYGPDILTYSAGQVVRGGSFDIANTPLLSPTDAITVGLPIVLNWARRAATPSDSYRILLMGTADASYWQSPPLGYVGSYTLTNLPSSFKTGTKYAWMIEIDTNDGEGFSQEARIITFSGGN